MAMLVRSKINQDEWRCLLWMECCWTGIFPSPKTFLSEIRLVSFTPIFLSESGYRSKVNCGLRKEPEPPRVPTTLDPLCRAKYIYLSSNLVGGRWYTDWNQELWTFSGESDNNTLVPSVGFSLNHGEFVLNRILEWVIIEKKFYLFFCNRSLIAIPALARL